MRIYYHLLLRRYIVESGYTTRTAASLSEALAMLGQIDDWQVLERGALKTGRRYDARLRLRLDSAQLPKPLSIGAVTATNGSWRPPGMAGRLTLPLCPRLAALALMRSLIAVALIMGIVLLSVLFYASSDSGAFSDTLPTLFIGGGALGVALLVLLGWRLWWLQKTHPPRRVRRQAHAQVAADVWCRRHPAGLVVYGARCSFSTVRSKPGSTCGSTMR